MRTPEMAQLENALTAAGALGGKAAGAGAGGSMFFVTGDDPAPATAAARTAGATVPPLRWAREGGGAWGRPNGWRGRARRSGARPPAPRSPRHPPRAPA